VRIIRNNKGSITLEAALILPLFLAFVVMLMVLIRMTIIQIALDNATSELTKQVSTHMYPIALVFDALSKTDGGETTLKIYDLVTKKESRDELANGSIDNLVEKTFTEPIQQMVGEIVDEALKAPIDKLDETVGADIGVGDEISGLAHEKALKQVQSIIDPMAAQLKTDLKAMVKEPLDQSNTVIDNYMNKIEAQITEAFNNLMKLILLKFADSKIISEPQKLKVTLFKIPDLRTAKNPLFSIGVEYHYLIRVPFISREVILHSKAMERVWVGSR
jgi:hypothetical protein